MFQCSPCEKMFTGKENYDQHLVSNKHRKKMLSLGLLGKEKDISHYIGGAAENLADGHAASKSEFNNIECEACNILFNTFENFHRHSVTLEHALKVQLKISNSNSASNVSDTTDSDNYEVHSSSNDTKHDDEIVIGLNSDYKSLQCSSYKSCAVCNKNFSSLESYKQHIESENHKEKAQLQRNSLDNCTANSYNELHHTENDTKPEVVPGCSNVYTRPQSLFYLSCNVCKKNFSCEESYKQHIVSEDHKKVELQKSLADKTNQSIAPYSCETCSKIFSGEVPYKQHMDSETHKKKQRQHSQLLQHFQSYSGNSPGQKEKSDVVHANNPWFCKVCKVQCTGLAPFQQHLKGSAHFKKCVAQGLNDELKIDIDRMPPVQESNYNANGVLEILDNTPKILNGSIQKNNQKIEDTLIPEIGIKLKVMDTDELEQSMKIFLPDQKVDFDLLCSAHEDNNHEETSQIKEKSEKPSNCEVLSD